MSQRVLVTAGASGIGREFVRAFAAKGARVFVSDIDSKALDVLAGEVKGLVTGICDNSKRSDIEAMVPAAAEALGGLDVLINNAGIAGPTAPAETLDPDEWETVISVNLTGTFNVTRLAIPYLKKSTVRRKRSKELRPVVFVPRTLGRTWGTRQRDGLVVCRKAHLYRYGFAPAR